MEPTIHERRAFRAFGKLFTGIVIKRPIDGGINLLMLRDKIPMRASVKPEERLCIDFADRLRELTLTKKLRGIWSHVPNEGKRHRFVAMILKAMGLIPGAPDYFFIWRTGGGVIDFKVKPNGLSDTQSRYRDWCQANGVNWALVKSKGDSHQQRIEAIEEALGILSTWGAVA